MTAINIAVLLWAISQVEGASPAQANGSCVGAFQIKPVFVEECNRIIGNKVFILADRENPISSRTMVYVWLTDRMEKHPDWTVWDLALAYNAGDDGAKNPTIGQRSYAAAVENLYRDAMKEERR